MPGYKLRNHEISFTDFNLWVITNEGAFDKTFMQKNETALIPRFDKELLLAAKVETKNNIYKVRFIKIISQKEDLHVHLNVQREREKFDGEKGKHDSDGMVDMVSVFKATNYEKYIFTMIKY